MFDLDADLEHKVRYLLAGWPDHRPDQTELERLRLVRADTREGLIELMRTADQERLRELQKFGTDLWGRERTQETAERDSSKLMSLLAAEPESTHDSDAQFPTVPEAAGAWVFRADACGEMPPDDRSIKELRVDFGNQLEMVPEQVSIPLAEHSPGLLAFDLS